MLVYVLSMDYDDKHNFKMSILRKVLQFNETKHIYSSFAKANKASCELVKMFEEENDFIDTTQEYHDGVLRRTIIFTDYCEYDMEVIIEVEKVEVM